MNDKVAEIKEARADFYAEKSYNEKLEILEKMISEAVRIGRQLGEDAILIVDDGTAEIEIDDIVKDLRVASSRVGFLKRNRYDRRVRPADRRYVELMDNF